MSNKRYILLVLVSAITVIIVAAIWKYPDAVKAQSKRDEKLGEYVYVDRLNIIHVARKCPKLNYKGFKSERIKVDEMYLLDNEESRPITFCPNCVSDKDYDILSQKVQCKE